MVQIFFIITMLAVAALMLRLFWSLEDSYREEERMMARLYSARYPKKPAGSGFTMNVGSISPRTVSIRSVTYHSTTRSERSKSGPMSSDFFTVGLPDDEDLRSTSTSRPECA